MSKGPAGVSLAFFEDPDDDGFNLQPTAETDFSNPNRLSPAVKRAIIVEKSQGVADQIIALRYDTTEHRVKKVWQEFIDSTSDVRRLGDENPEVFRQKIRRKAVHAVEAGLDCDRDPYRQANVGIQVMKGIGDFTETKTTTNLHLLVAAVPDEWKQRYIGPSNKNPKVIDIKAEVNKEEDDGK